MASPSSPKPEGSRPPVAVMGTLMPHMAAGRHHVYRDVTALALLAALVAAGLGSLSVALVLAAVALPAAVLTFVHDHRLWRDEPLTVVGLTFGLSLLLGVGVGLLETHFIRPVAVASTGYHLPPVSRVLELGVLVPVAALVAVVVAPLLVSARAAFRHPMDVVLACSLSGAASSFGLSVVVQHGAFAHVQATAGDPAHVAFIALTLGFCNRSCWPPRRRWRYWGCAAGGSTRRWAWSRAWCCWWPTSWPLRCCSRTAPAGSC